MGCAGNAARTARLTGRQEGPEASTPVGASALQARAKGGFGRPERAEARRPYWAAGRSPSESQPAAPKGSEARAR